jgi:threonine/homoserine/homoserine lactone efflux protein
MNAYFEGIFLGLALSVMVGPLLIALVSTSLEYGQKAGLFVALGVWLSDMTCFGLAYLGIGKLVDVSANANFELYVGIGGGVILTIFGLVYILGAREQMKLEQLNVGQRDKESADSMNAKKPMYVHLIKGILINTVNPFTIIFWSGVASTAITDKTQSGAFLFFLGIMTALVLLDSLKVLMADRVKSRLESGFILKFRLVSGVALIFFGAVMLVRVL